MLKTIDGFHFRNIIDSGVRYLENNINVINDLNVFPVPDGDTGTNMVLTVKNGLASINNTDDKLSALAQTFGDAVIFGARGNSGVIFSQFLKGICEGLKSVNEADSSAFCDAVSNGVKFAYGAVAHPVEGTILTVIKEASQALEANKATVDSIDDAVSVFVRNAKDALEKTTDMLPVLKKAGVVDSGGAGLVCFFEGIQKYLNGETIDISSQAEAIPSYVDYSVYNKNSKFKFGYCTELLIQLLDCKEELDINYFRNTLEDMGDSLVTSYDADKLRVHIHTHNPEQILEFCHRFGEFLSLKIENMTVQHTQLTPKLVCSDNDDETAYTTVAVAPNKHLADIFINMGADVVMLNEACPATEDFIEAFEKKSGSKIVVFPNDPDSVLA
ncbi:MAG: DAK2 domain-containing protein, partial [Acutalibacteraceae bacterium]|nr:DAK2 domain-containing protein [Acutalibacteraceae bacterium]